MVEIAVEFWLILGEMAPYLLLGFLIAGVLSAAIPAELIERHMGGRGPWPVVKAALFGIPLPLCSCGVIPVGASLRRHGASRGASASFLISTPQTGVDSILVTYSLLGLIFTVYRVVVAFISGVVGGWLVEWAARGETQPEKAEAADPGAKAGDSCGCGNGEESCGDDDCGYCGPNGGDGRKGLLPATRHALRYGFITLPRDIGRALLLGLLIAGVISAVVPQDYFGAYLGGGVFAMLVMLALGIPVYVCATASVPVAAALIAAGVSPGAALVFLITGPATNAAAITTLWQVLGRRATYAYLATVALTALLAGLLLDQLYTATGTTVLQHTHELLPGWFKHGSAVALLALLAYALLPRRKAAQEVKMREGEEKLELKVSGMTCSHCAATVERALRGQAGVSAVQVDLAGGKATVVGRDLSIDRLVQAVEEVGYQTSPAADE